MVEKEGEGREANEEVPPELILLGFLQLEKGTVDQKELI